MKIYITISMVTIFLLLSIGSAMAATLSVSGPGDDVILGEQFTVDVSLITLGEQVNAVEGEVLYDRDLLYVEEIREDGSAIGLWLTRPQKAEPGMVRFSGVIPGGNPSARTHILTLVFKPLAAGSARVWLRENSRAFLNDGAGTPVPLSFEDYRVSVLENIPDNLRVPDRAASSSPLVVEDHELPLPFQPELGRDESVFGGQWFVAFSAIDKSGIDHYEIYEGKKVQKSAVPSWARAESPYVLGDQSLRSYIYVRAVDRVGNERVAIVEPEIRTNWFVWIIIGVIVLLAVAGWKHNKNSKFT